MMVTALGTGQSVATGSFWATPSGKFKAPEGCHSRTSADGSVAVEKKQAPVVLFWRRQHHLMSTLRRIYMDLIVSVLVNARWIRQASMNAG